MNTMGNTLEQQLDGLLGRTEVQVLRLRAGGEPDDDVCYTLAAQYLDLAKMLGHPEEHAVIRDLGMAMAKVGARAKARAGIELFKDAPVRFKVGRRQA